MKLIQMIPLKDLAREAKSLRHQVKMNVRDAAKAAKVSSSTLSRVENKYPCDAETYVRISAWIVNARLGISVPDVLRRLIDKARRA